MRWLPSQAPRVSESSTLTPPRSTRMSSVPPPAPALTVVVPVHDEEESLPRLHREIAASVGGMGRSWEVVYVDDGSRDRSYEVLVGLHESDPEHVRVLHLARNYGQTAAMAAGFDHGRGEVVVTLDGDLQNDPADIPRLVAVLEAGHDVVVGWRKDRRDGFLLRRVPSILANRIIARVTGATVHDTGCTLKAFRRELVANMPIYAEQHRFLPVLALGSGARIAEVVVNHRPRTFGRSKYGLSRAVRVLLDLLTVKMIASFSRAPLQYFALLAAPFAMACLGFAANAVLHSGAVTFEDTWGQAALLVFMLLTMVGVYFLMLGLLAELAVKASNVHRGREPLRQGGGRS